MTQGAPAAAAPARPAAVRASGVVAMDAATRLGAIFTGKALALISVPVIARALGPETYGTFALLTVFAQYAAVPVEFGFRAHGIREVARNPEGTAFVSEMLSARLTIALASYLAAAVAGVLLFRGQIAPWIPLVSLLVVFAAALDIDFFYFGRRRFAFPSLLDVGLQGLYVAGVVLWVRTPADLAVLVALTALQPLCNSVILLAEGSARPLTVRLGVRRAADAFRRVWLLGLGAKGSLVFNTLPLIVLGAVAARRDIGTFAAAMKLFGVFGLAVQTSLQVLAPRLVSLSRRDAARRRAALRLLAGLALAAGAALGGALWIAAPYVVEALFGASFAGAVPVVRLMAVLLIPLWIVYLLAVSWLNNFGQDAAYVRGSGVLVASLALLLPGLAPAFGAAGVIAAMGGALALATAYYGRTILRTAGYGPAPRPRPDEPAAPA